MGVTLCSVLAIDAGNSKTDVALLGPDGSVLVSGQAGGFQPSRTGVAAAVDVIAEAMASVGMYVRGRSGPAPSTCRPAWPTRTSRWRSGSWRARSSAATGGA